MEKLTKEILEQDIDLVRIVEGFILDRLEQYRDNPDLILLNVKNYSQQLSQFVDEKLIDIVDNFNNKLEKEVNQLRNEICRLEFELLELKKNLNI